MRHLAGLKKTAVQATVLLSLLYPVLLVSTVIGDEAPGSNSAPQTDPISVSMRPGGTGRFAVNRWGMVRAKIFNRQDHPASSLVVVTPSGSEGMQYARQINVPANVAFDTVWPVHISEISAEGSVNFQYLFFPDGVDDGSIRHAKHDKEIPSFHGMSTPGTQSLTGLIVESSLDRDDATSKEAIAHQMMAVMKFTNGGSASVISINTNDLTVNPECLDPLDQLAICDSQLVHHPHVCDAIRLWVQRGGRLMILLERSGAAVAEAILGDSLPITVVGECTTNELTLDLNPDYPISQYPVRSVTRKFDEPIRYVRIVPGDCETIWSVDGWPLATRANIGRGVVVLTTISSDAFIEPAAKWVEGNPSHAMIASSRRMLESLFEQRNQPLITEAAAAEAAASLIGYEIPGRSVALLLLSIFPVSLLAAGLLLQRKLQGQRLILVLPCLALLTSVPTAIMGLKIRSVAPATLIETAVVQPLAGFTELPSDGFATAFVPVPSEVKVASTEGATMQPVPDSTNADYRRLIWRGPAEVSWMNLRQPAGLRTYPMKATLKLKAPLRAVATFTEKGLEGSLYTGDNVNVSDVILAGSHGDNLSLNVSDGGKFQGNMQDSLNPNEFYKDILLTDRQRFRKTLLTSVFASTSGNQVEPFPHETSLVYWDDSARDKLQFTQDDVVGQRSVLMVQPLQLVPPETGRTITIPSPFMKFRSITNASGGLSSIFSNMKRQWLPQESGAQALLEFQIPEVCIPFDVDSGDLTMRIHAGSRLVTISAGDPTDLQLIGELRSPLGVSEFKIPGELIRATCRTGKLYLQIEVTELDASMNSEEMSGEQDDSWQIERLQLSLTGRRQP